VTRAPTGRAAVGGPPAPHALRERGSVPIELVLGLGVLVLPIALLVALFPGWAERTAMARVATQEAARAAALAVSAEEGRAAALALVEQIAVNHDVPLEDLLAAEVHVPVDATGDLLRGGEVVATVRIAIPTPAVPLLPTGATLSRTVTHRERLDDYRSLP
jgi:hypothetical protein